MPTTFKGPSTRKRLERIGTIFRNSVNETGEDIKKQLQQIVSPLESNINIISVSRTDTEDYIVEIMGNPNDVATINAGGSPVSSHDLLKFLDGGTDVKYVGMPVDFQHETWPGTRATSHREYDRDDVYFLPEPEPGIPAREWFKGLLEEFGPKIKVKISQDVRSFYN